MELLTQQILSRLPKLYSDEETPLRKRIIVCKFFMTDGNWTWYVVEGQPTGDSDFRFWGLVRGHVQEWGDFLLSDLKSLRSGVGLAVERDLHFTPGTVESHALTEGIDPEVLG